MPEGVDESHVLGAHFGEPIDVVRAETVELPVPATAEIVIEGHISHTEVDHEVRWVSILVISTAPKENRNRYCT